MTANPYLIVEAMLKNMGFGDLAYTKMASQLVDAILKANTITPITKEAPKPSPEVYDEYRIPTALMEYLDGLQRVVDSGSRLDGVRILEEVRRFLSTPPPKSPGRTVKA